MLDTGSKSRIGGTSPDIYNIYSIWAPQLAAAGALAEPPAAVQDWIRGAYGEGTVGAATINGTLWGIPTELSVYQLLYNKKLLEAAREFYGKFVAERGQDPGLKGELGRAMYRLAQITADYEAKLAALKAEYPAQIARRMAHALLQQGGKTTIEELLKTTPTVVPNAAPVMAVAAPSIPSAAPVPPSAAAEPQLTAATAAAAVAVAEPDELAMDAFIESARCTTCNECTNLNNRMFAYNGDKQA